MDKRWPNLGIIRDIVVAERFFLTIWKLKFLPDNVDMSKSENLMRHLQMIYSSKYINRPKRDATK